MSSVEAAEVSGCVVAAETSDLSTGLEGADRLTDEDRRVGDAEARAEASSGRGSGKYGLDAPSTNPSAPPTERSAARVHPSVAIDVRGVATGKGRSVTAVGTVFGCVHDAPQHATVPFARSAHVRCIDRASRVAPTPVMVTGVTYGCWDCTPGTTWPQYEYPAQRTSPDTRATQVWDVPTATSTASLTPPIASTGPGTGGLATPKIPAGPSPAPWTDPSTRRTTNAAE